MGIEKKRLSKLRCILSEQDSRPAKHKGRNREERICDAAAWIHWRNFLYE
jgi:hypothetical protein